MSGQGIQAYEAKYGIAWACETSPDTANCYRFYSCLRLSDEIVDVIPADVVANSIILFTAQALASPGHMRTVNVR